MLPEQDSLEQAETLIAGGHPAEAVRLMRAQLEAGRGGLLMRLSLARALMRAGDGAGALETARQTAALYPGIAVVAVGLGQTLRNSGYLPAAIGEFQRALRIDPECAGARFELGCAWLEAGEADKALEAFSRLCAEEEADLPARVAQAQAMRARPRSDAGYVRHLFDQFAADYDARMLDQLSYAGPSILRQLADLVLPRRDDLSILDLGCGTGLSGMAFKDVAARMDGIDLSPAMIEKARARGLYDELCVADIETALAQGGRDYDLLIAADCLVYLGDLQAVFQGAARRLKPHGFFLFTVEKNDGDGFALGPKRRWRHSDPYVREQARLAGFEIAGLVACSPRTEANVPVEGLAVALGLLS